jgi:3-oxoacyl-[acyl-carrier protein] reductase
MKIDLSNKHVLVTGGTKGIGSAIVNKFLDVGAKVTATGTKTQEVKNLNKKNKDTNLCYLNLDFLDDSSLQQFKSECDKLGGVDILINNAGINIVSDFLETTEDQYERIEKVNIRGPYNLCKYVLPHMKNQKSGKIINIASIWSVISREGRSIYSTTKNAVLGMTKTLALEFASDNILTNAISPGFTLTKLTESTNTPEELQNIKKEIPLKRMAKPEEIADLAVFLSSELNHYITGQNIVIDGGYTIK